MPAGLFGLQRKRKRLAGPQPQHPIWGRLSSIWLISRWTKETYRRLLWKCPRGSPGEVLRLVQGLLSDSQAGIRKTQSEPLTLPASQAGGT